MIAPHLAENSLDRPTKQIDALPWSGAVGDGKMRNHTPQRPAADDAACPKSSSLTAKIYIRPLAHVDGLATSAARA
jgi:hypothetical protein